MAGPKIKFTKEIIIEKSITFIDSNGIDEASIRNLSKYIGCSTQPIFRLYANSESLFEDILENIKNHYDEFIDIFSKKESNPFLGIGLGYINFAKEHPNLFYALFMDKNYKKKNFLDFFSDDESNLFLHELSKQIGLTIDNSRLLLRNIWILCHGIATMIYTNQVNYDDKEIRQMLFQGFNGFIYILKETKND